MIPLKPEAFFKSLEEPLRICRYLLVGGWNTLFGIGVYALLVAFPWGREHYLAVCVPANILAISNAFLCYKLFVFRTKGMWLREYLRCYVVYGAGALLGVVLLYLFVEFLGLHPVAAQCLGLLLTTVCSYLGHKFFSFGRRDA
jgi:putative flippase GtrA